MPASKPAQPDPTTVQALTWWISQHVPSFAGSKLTHTSLMCAGQDFAIDWWNCGLFSFNALEHAFLPERYCLLENTNSPVFTDLARLEVLRRLIKRHNVVVPSNAALPSTASKSPLSPPTPSLNTNASGIKISNEMVDHILFGKNASKINTAPSVKGSNKQASQTRTLNKPSKKRKSASDKSSSTSNIIKKSVIAPIFKQKVLGPKAAEYMTEWHKQEEHKNSDDSSSGSDTEVDSDNGTSSLQTGRPTLDILDQLTVELESLPKMPRKYKCAGEGCSKTWQPHSQARILAHGKLCLHLSSKLRKSASKASAATAPGALVARTPSLSTIPSSPLSVSSTPGTGPVVVDTPSKPCRIDVSFFGPGAQRILHKQLDFAIVKLFCMSHLPPALADSPEWKALFALQTPSYQPASRTKLMESHILSEQSNVRELQITYLKSCRSTLSFDAGALRSGEAVISVHATTNTGVVFLLEGQECTTESHTGEYIATLVIRVAETIGTDLIDAVSSDSTGNMSTAREIICARLPTVLNLPDPIHHLNNTWKEIASIEFFEEVIDNIRKIIKQFSHSNRMRGLLRSTREKMALGPGLESIGKTRFSTLTWSAISLQRCLPAIKELCQLGKIDLKEQNDLFVDKMASLQFDIVLTQFIAVGEGIARAIECLKASATSPADVYLYWLAVLSHIKNALQTSKLPDAICAKIRSIVVERWRQFFVEGPTNVHKAAFFLNPNYARSTIFKKPNPLALSIVLPATQPANVPPGIAHPKTFLEIGKYLHTLLETEVKAGNIPYLRRWRGRRQAFAKAYQAQFTAYARGAWPFATPLVPGQSVLEWWRAFKGQENGGILAAIAIKLNSVTPHSMADERTMSAVTMINTAQHNRQKVDTVIAMAQVRSYYMRECKSKPRKSAHPLPIIKFFDINRFIRTIDDETRPDMENPNYDESNDENNDKVSPKPINSIKSTVSGSDGSRLPLDNDDDEEVDLTLPELEEILADGPSERREHRAVSSKGQHQLSSGESAETLAADDDFIDDGEFELEPWV